MRSTNTFGVRFIIRCTKARPGIAAIYARVTVNKKRIEIALKQTVDPLLWNGSKGCVEGNKEVARKINPYIEEVRYKLMEAYQEMRLQDKLINAESLKRVFIGEEKALSSLVSLMTYHRANANSTLRKGTLKNYAATEKYLLRFLKHRHKASDIFLEELNFQFITEFELFLRTTKPLASQNPLGDNGVMKHMERLKKMVTMAVKMEWISKDPFVRYKLRFKKSEREFLLMEEMDILGNTGMPNQKLEKCRDIFLFCCYTGLAYIDLFHLTPDNILLGIDGGTWLKTTRQKTDVKVSVPLLTPALDLLTKYKDDRSLQKQGRILPCPSNQKVNEYLKEIGKLCGFRKNLTFHLARHTFATSVTLNNGIPLETVSKMLGHTKLSTTQVYIHVLERKISEDMKQLRHKFAVPSLKETSTVVNFK